MISIYEWLNWKRLNLQLDNTINTYHNITFPFPWRQTCECSPLTSVISTMSVLTSSDCRVMLFACHFSFTAHLWFLKVIFRMYCRPRRQVHTARLNVCLKLRDINPYTMGLTQLFAYDIRWNASLMYLYGGIWSSGRTPNETKILFVRIGAQHIINTTTTATSILTTWNIQ